MAGASARAELSLSWSCAECGAAGVLRFPPEWCCDQISDALLEAHAMVAENCPQPRCYTSGNSSEVMD